MEAWKHGVVSEWHKRFPKKWIYQTQLITEEDDAQTSPDSVEVTQGDGVLKQLKYSLKNIRDIGQYSVQWRGNKVQCHIHKRKALILVNLFTFLGLNYF